MKKKYTSLFSTRKNPNIYKGVAPQQGLIRNKGQSATRVNPQQW